MELEIVGLASNEESLNLVSLVLEDAEEVVVEALDDSIRNLLLAGRLTFLSFTGVR